MVQDFGISSDRPVHSVTASYYIHDVWHLTNLMLPKADKMPNIINSGLFVTSSLIKLVSVLPFCASILFSDRQSELSAISRSTEQILNFPWNLKDHHTLSSPPELSAQQNLSHIYLRLLTSIFRCDSYIYSRHLVHDLRI